MANIKHTTRKITAGYTRNLPNHRDSAPPSSPIRRTRRGGRRGGRGRKSKQHKRNFDEFPRVLNAEVGQVLPTRRKLTFEQLLAQHRREDAAREARYAEEDAAEAAEVLAGISNQVVSSAATQGTPTAEPEAWVADLAPTAPENGPHTVAHDDEDEEPVANITGNKRNRPQCKSKGGVSYNKPRARNPESWTVSYMRCRVPFNTEAEAYAALARWKEHDMCPGCDRLRVIPPPIPAPIPQISCTATARGVLQVTVNGATFTVKGKFVYP